MNVQVFVGTDLLCFCTAPPEENHHTGQKMEQAPAPLQMQGTKVAQKWMDGAV